MYSVRSRAVVNIAGCSSDRWVWTQYSECSYWCTRWLPDESKVVHCMAAEIELMSEVICSAINTKEGNDKLTIVTMAEMVTVTDCSPVPFHSLGPRSCISSPHLVNIQSLEQCEVPSLCWAHKSNKLDYTWDFSLGSKMINTPKSSSGSFLTPED